MSRRGTWTVWRGRSKKDVSYDVYTDADVSNTKEGCLIVSQYSQEEGYWDMVAVYAPKTWRRAQVHKKTEDTA